MKGTALITGATSGLGLELAQVFAAEGHDLVLSGRNEESLKKVCEEIEGRWKRPVRYIVADLSREGSARGVFDEAAQRGITVEYLVNNAGTQIYGEFSGTDLEKTRALIGVNLTSLVELCRYFLPGMKERKSGKILNIGSTGSFAPGPLNAVYCATKAFVLSFSEAVNEELAGTGVRITTLCPGATRTRFAEKAGIETVRLFRWTQMEADRVALIGYRALMRGKRTVVAGWINRIQVAAIRFSPRTMVTKLSRALMST